MPKDPKPGSFFDAKKLKKIYKKPIAILSNAVYNDTI
ncbi:MAG: hypothetical protein K0R93_2641 [Anaerosolibacter sp.]|jgi:hypothetical protein|nr:hypothetical protein [Anaerosolibacter sp.]